MKPVPFRNSRPVFAVGGQTKQSNHEVVSDGGYRQNQRELRQLKRELSRLTVKKTINLNYDKTFIKVLS